MPTIELALIFLAGIVFVLGAADKVWRDVIDPPFVESEPRNRDIEGLAADCRAMTSLDSDRIGQLRRARFGVTLP